MKTNLLLPGLFFFAGFHLHAQEIRFGILGGMGVTQSFWTHVPEHVVENSYNPIPSFSLNVCAGFKNKGIWGLSIEPGIIKKGGVDPNTPNEKEDNNRFELLYIHAPVLSDFYLGKKFMISVGPEFGYLISVKSYFRDFTTNLYEFYENKFEVCGLLGANYIISENVDIGIRYSRGFIHSIRYVTTDINGQFSGDIKEYSQYLHFIARYKFNSKNKS